MRGWIKFGLWMAGLGAASGIFAQEPKKVLGPDDRFKADILVVVAHPDDEGAVTPYLARAIYDLHKRVAVVYATHGNSGGNSYGSERAGALADIREMEAREACARMGITNVWFLDGKDTASQNVLNSLANWGHGENLEKLVELMRLTRPDVVMSSIPGVFIGEDHGDHQAAGVLATEAFDLAGSATAFPAQLAGASPKRELYLENLNAWQPKKLYFFADGDDDKVFVGSGPAYSITEVSPSQQKPYWRIAISGAMTHLTQYPAEIHALMKLNDAEIEKRMTDPNTGWWSNPETLVFGKSVVGGAKTDDVFAGIDGDAGAVNAPMAATMAMPGVKGDSATLGGPWGFYEKFREVHGLTTLPVTNVPEIAIKAGEPVYVPLEVRRVLKEDSKISIKADLPASWKVKSGTGEFLLPLERSTALRVEIDTPTLSAEELKSAKAQEIVIHVEENGKEIGEVKLRVLLRAGGLPQ
jgi:LmbE family N-acetylglucosaminyl deacetylase